MIKFEECSIDGKKKRYIFGIILLKIGWMDTEFKILEVVQIRLSQKEKGLTLKVQLPD
jgi:hypothetical protein